MAIALGAFPYALRIAGRPRVRWFLDREGPPALGRAPAPREPAFDQLDPEPALRALFPDASRQGGHETAVRVGAMSASLALQRERGLLRVGSSHRWADR